MRICGGCHQVNYCCHSCQKAHWKQHRDDCGGNGGGNGGRALGRALHSRQQAITKDSISTEQRFQVAFGVYTCATQLRISPSDMQWTVAISVPDLPCMHKYMQWHLLKMRNDLTYCTDVVPLLLQPVCDYRKEYGSDAVCTTIRSLRKSGVPWPAWKGVPKPMEIDILVIWPSGTTQEFTKCKVSHTVAWLREKVLHEMVEPNVRRWQHCNLQLIADSTVLEPLETLSQAGLTNGTIVTLVVTEGSEPDLVGSSSGSELLLRDDPTSSETEGSDEDWIWYHPTF